MLDIINRYAHGFVAIPTILACRESGLFKLLEQNGPLTSSHITQKLQSNKGHLQVALRMFESLGWLVRDNTNAYSYSPGLVHSYQEIPSHVLELYHFDMISYLTGNDYDKSLQTWITLSKQGWQQSDKFMADLLDGVLVIPILLALHNLNLLKTENFFVVLNVKAQTELIDLFTHHHWIEQKQGKFILTETGRFLTQRTLILGTTASYRPMLANMSELLFGDVKTVFGRDAAGHETHVDRTLNVIGSGFQHEKFFADVDGIIIRIFNQLPYEQQPNFIIDMGCGDGTFLKRVYSIIQQKTTRGQYLDKYPIKMIGVDFNEKALDATTQTLAGIPHFVLPGDIGNPAKMMIDLQKYGVSADEVLHIRSFLDHDRPFIPPTNLEAVEQRHRIPYQGVYVDAQGQAIEPAVAVQSLVEHLAHWAEILGPHGLIGLEVHCLTPQTVRKYLDQSESLHFDAYHAFSSQFLVEADVFLMSAAEVGLFPKTEFSGKYPQIFSFSRITLNWFEKRPYRVRQAQLTDMPALLALEIACWPEPMRVSEVELRRRLQVFPAGQCVLEIKGNVVGVIYSQLIAQSDLLKNITFAQLPTLHQPNASVIQLLNLNVLPEVHDQGLGDQFLEFALHWFTHHGNIDQVVGVTRCKNYAAHMDMPMEVYIHARNKHGHLLDPILHFHEAHGANIKQVIPHYRPQDIDNQGAGVLIEYNLSSYKTERTQPKYTQPIKVGEVFGNGIDIAGIVKESIQAVKGKQGLPNYNPNWPLMEMGLDSLELLELRVLLGQRLQIELDPTFFFQYNTPHAIIRFFETKKLESKPPLAAPIPLITSDAVPAISNPLSITQEDFLSSKTVSPEKPKLDSTSTIEPIAVIGMSCRFPHGANSIDDYWQLLCNGVDGITEIPPSRWDVDTYYASNSDQPGKITTRYGGFLDEVDKFDAPFFRISPREAKTLDPQQRILLEVSWEALEHAGINPQNLQGSQTGVYIGIISHDYEILQHKQNQPQDYEAYFSTGNSASIAAGRIAYFLGLQGPAMSVDTACSSSLVAIHLACQGLLTGETKLALAGGVNLLLSPELTLAYSKAGMLAPDGRCKTFDAQADGYVRSEGCGVVVLKRLSEAMADNDPILAVIRGTALNQDGASNGLTAPNGFAQVALVQKSLQVAQISPAEISYVEAHGTGTSLGDPIEFKALAEVYSQGRSSNNPLMIGSVKTNIGHTEAAAGMAGLIKVILSLQHAFIPPHLHFKTLNPLINLNSIPAIIPTQGQFWSVRKGAKRLAGVSAFGFSGTNAHVILEQAPSPQPVSNTITINPPYYLLTLSAHNNDILCKLLENYEKLFTQLPQGILADLCFTANTGRAKFTHRLAIVAESKNHMQQLLHQYVAGATSSQVFAHVLKPNLPKIAYLFTGQGSQYVNMGRELYQIYPVFRAALNQCAAILEPYMDLSLLDVLYPPYQINFTEQTHLPIHQTIYTQPALFALEYSLAQLWLSWGITPDVVMGHSVGEYVAACVAGVFSLADGLKLIAARGRLMQALPAGGRMVAILADAPTVSQVVEPYAEWVSVAALNGPRNTVISGAGDKIQEIVTQFKAQKIKCVELTVSHAFHSPLMQPMLAEFRQIAETIVYTPPTLKLVSNVTGQLATHEVTTAEYWVSHVQAAVQFAPSMQTLQDYTLFLEVGPKPTLLGMGKQCLEEKGQEWLPSLRAGQAEIERILQTLGSLFTLGLEINWAGVYVGQSLRRVALPTYPFQRERYWIETADTSSPVAKSATSWSSVFEQLHQGNITELVKRLQQQGRLEMSQAPLLTSLLQNLTHIHQQEIATHSIQDWFYEVAWQPQTAPATPLEISPSTWLIFVDNSGLGQALSEKLQALNHTPIWVCRGETYHVQPPTSTQPLTYWLDPTNPQQFLQLFQTLADQPLKRVLYLWGLDIPSSTDLTLETLPLVQTLTLNSGLSLVQAMAKLGVASRVCFVTCEAVPIQTKPVSVGASLLWGLGKVVALEHPEFWGGLYDVSSAVLPLEQDSLFHEIASTGLEDQVAWQAGQRFVARLKRTQPVVKSPLTIQPEATYLITGGVGALGLEVAEWLAHHGARYLVLTSRRGPSTPEASACIERLDKLGVKVWSVAVDGTEVAAMTRLVATLEAEYPPLKGVIHAAGTVTLESLAELNLAEVEAVLQPKVRGAWLLHQLTQHLPLDFFVTFSSIAAVWGSKGQGHYAAANQFLDSLAHYRRHLGLPALSINWGLWGGAGLGGAEVRTWLTRSGLDFLPPAQAVVALGQLLQTEHVQMVVAGVNWAVFKPLYEARGQRPFLEAFQIAQEESVATPAVSTFINQLQATPKSQQYELLQTQVQQDVAAVLGLTTAHQLAVHQSFFDLGLDSLMAMEVSSRLQVSLGQKLEGTLAFNYPTVRSLTDYLASKLLTPTEVTPTPVVSASPIAAHEPIAVIGIGCRLPGGINDPEAFWQFLCRGGDAIIEIPPDRWDAEAFYDPHLESYDKMNTRWGGFVEALDQFDPTFFGLARREIAGMDPQQRLILEVAWEALERSGIAPTDLAGTNTSVFVGIGAGDYAKLLIGPPERGSTGIANSIIANRLSYLLDLHGPSVALDTACSSSLVAVHLACQSLRTGESDLALVGGVNVILNPEMTVSTSQAGMMAWDGHCKTFDAAADGYVRSEGCGVVVLKPLTAAQRDGDSILALIRGSAVNQDGYSIGLTAPNGLAQQAVVRKALAVAGLNPAEIDYVEMHGTGTPLGDSIEVQALATVLKAQRPLDRPCVIGSVKTNIGHLEAAAGVAGLIKTVLTLQHGTIPPHPALKTLNPKLELEQTPFIIPTLDKPAVLKPRYAGVSSFGFGGTNAHVILEAASIPELPQTPQLPSQWLALSAKQPKALQELVTKYLDYLDTHPDVALADLCYTANQGRSHFNQRLAWVATDSADLAQQLRQGAYTIKTAADAPKVAFLFTGQGSQYLSMGQHLYETEPVFRQTLQQCHELLQPYLDRPLLDLLYPQPSADSPLNHTRYAQPAIFALGYALAQLWQAWGVAPQVVMGHSVGEYIAACVAGVFTLEEGLRLISERGRLMGQLPVGGGMMAIFAPLETVQQAIAPYSETVAIAAVNGEKQIVISGPQETLQIITNQLEEEFITSRPLNVSHAFHSPLMTPILESFNQFARQIQFNVPHVPFISNVTGQLLPPQTTLDATYWTRHIREPVQFYQSIQTLVAQEVSLFLELGPTDALVGLGKRCVPKGTGVWITSMKHHPDQPQAEWTTLWQAAATLYQQGVNFDWAKVYAHTRRPRLALPTYPFQRKRCWLEPSEIKTYRKQEPS